MKLSEIEQKNNSTGTRMKLSTVQSQNAPKVEKDKGFLGNIAADIVRPVARVATNLVNTGEAIAGRNPTSPFSGSFLGQVKPVGMEDGGGLSVKNLKDAVGVGLELSSNIPIAKGARITGDVLKGVTKGGGLRTLYKAATPLIKEGAIGGSLGNAGRSLEENKSMGGVALDTAKGAVVGGLAAPVLGAVAGLGGKVLNKYTNADKLFKGESKYAKEAAEKELDDIADYVSAPIDSKLKQNLRKGQRETEYPGLFSKKRFKLGDEDYEVAQATKDIVDPRLTANENIDAINKNISSTYQDEMIPFLQENPSPYNWSELNTYMGAKMKPSSMIRPGGDEDYAFNAIKKNALDIIKNYPPTTEGIQKARIEIDDMIEREFGSAIWDRTGTKPMATGAKEAALKVRTALNDFTEDSLKFRNIEAVNKADNFLKEARKRGIRIDTPEEARYALLGKFGAEILPENELKALLFRNKLRNLTLKYKAADNIWRKEATEVGKDRLQNIKNPLVKKVADNALGYIATGGALYGLNKIFNGGPLNNSN